MTDGLPHSGECVRMEVKSLVKSFGPVRALDGANFQLASGEIHALLGENGAGKSTLSRILSGHGSPDSGELFLSGSRLTLSGPRHALRQGIVLLEQDVKLVPSLSVTENLSLGMEPGCLGLFWDAREAIAQATLALERVGLDLDPGASTETLSVPERQLVALAKALAFHPRVLILDEPTAVLSPEQVARVFELLRRLKEEGTSVVFITHKLPEVFQIADRATVLHRGRSVLVRDLQDSSEEDLLRAMMGEEASQDERCPRTPRTGREVLALSEVCCEPKGGEPGLKEVTLTVREGEIVTVLGSPGNGQQHLASLLMGQSRPTQGSIRVMGQSHRALDPGVLRRLGVRWVPEDRIGEAMVADMPVWENVLLGGVASHRPGSIHWAKPERMKRSAAQLIQDWEVRAQGPSDSLRYLSGGNQQRILLARELEGDVSLLVAFSPTRGVDVRTAASIRRRLSALRDQGGAILLITQDVEEASILADRIFVLYRGQMRETGSDAGPGQVLSMMTGGGT